MSFGDMDLEHKIDNYLKERFEPAASLISLEPLDEGVHGTVYRIAFSTPDGKKRLISTT